MRFAKATLLHLDHRELPGLVTEFVAAGGPGVRIDTHVTAGYRIPPLYDSMIAKVLVHADTREQAILRMRRAMDEFHIAGVKSNISLHRRILRNAYFQRGEYSTRFLDDLLSA